MDKLRALRSVVAIAEAGSLTAAAERTGQSLPAVVRGLAALEAELGVRLFNRTTRRVALTEGGRRYLERARQVLALVHEAEAELRDEATELQGPIRLTAPVLFGQRHAVGSVLRFVQQHPRVRVDLQLLDRVVDLVEEGFDLGVRIGELPPSSLVARRVGAMRRVVVASPDYLARRGRPLHPRDLREHDCLEFSGSSGPWWAFSDGGRPLTVPVSGPVQANQTAPLVQACLAGMGLGAFISYQVADEVLDGRLQVVLAEYELPPRPVHLLMPQARRLPARTRALVDWLQADLSATLARWKAAAPAVSGSVATPGSSGARPASHAEAASPDQRPSGRPRRPPRSR